MNLLGTVEGIERFFFVEGAINVSQQFFTPFGAQPQGLANATQNRYTAASYRVTPYIQGITPGNIRYEVRNSNTWTNLSGAPISTENSYVNEWLGNVSSPVAPYGWAVDYERTDVKFTDQRPTITRAGPRDAALPGRSPGAVRSRRRVRGQSLSRWSTIVARYTAWGFNGTRPHGPASSATGSTVFSVHPIYWHSNIARRSPPLRCRRPAIRRAIPSSS